VFAAPGAAGVLLEPPVLLATVIAFLAFCLVASGTYLLNDALDVTADRLHPHKQHRPIATGVVPVGVAKACAITLLSAGVAVGLLVDLRLAFALGLYVAVMQAYSMGLKRAAVIELAVVSAGFVIRAVGGALAADVPVSTWFLIVTSFASLFIVVGKRNAERLTLGEDAVDHRPALAEYPAGFLQYVGAVAAAVAIIAYCLWALIGVQVASVWFELSIIPFVLAILRYALLAERGEAGAPEDVFLSDRTMLLLGVAWAVAFAAGLYAS
jgi:decaprenyl-phosphate phosphoribosyltransferase